EARRGRDGGGLPERPDLDVGHRARPVGLHAPRDRARHPRRPLADDAVPRHLRGRVRVRGNAVAHRKMKTCRFRPMERIPKPLLPRWALQNSRYGLPDMRACAPRPAANPWFSNKGKEIFSPVEPSSQASSSSLMSTERTVKELSA